MTKNFSEETNNMPSEQETINLLKILLIGISSWKEKENKEYFRVFSFSNALIV